MMNEEEKAKLEEIRAEGLQKGVLIGNIQFMGSDATWVIYLAGDRMCAEPYDEHGKSCGPAKQGTIADIMQSIYSAEMAAQTLAAHFKEIRDMTEEPS